MKLSRFLVVGGLAVLLLSAAVATAGDRRAHRDGVPDVATLQTTGGVLRKAGGDWRVFDPNHAHLGLGTVTCRPSGVLHVALDPTGNEVGFGVAAPDEKLAGLGVTVGISAATGELRLHFFRGFLKSGAAKKLSCASPLFDTPNSNLWLTWTQTVDTEPV